MTDHKLLLTLDTSRSHLTMGLYQIQPEATALQILAESFIDNDSQRYHSSMLMPELAMLFQKANRTTKDLTNLAIHVGPGSFTGIRTGLISARVFGQFLPIQTYTVNAFELAIFAANQFYPNQPICIALDARRGRAYSACGHYTAQGFQWQQEPSLLTLDAISSQNQGSTTIASQSLSEALAITQSLESLYENTPASQHIAKLIQTQPQIFQRPWQALIPLYLEEPNITLPKRNPAIIQASF